MTPKVPCSGCHADLPPFFTPILDKARCDLLSEHNAGQVLQVIHLLNTVQHPGWFSCSLCMTTWERAGMGAYVVIVEQIAI